MLHLRMIGPAGYDVAHMPSDEHGRQTFGGLTDQGFKVPEIIARCQHNGWPF